VSTRGRVEDANHDYTDGTAQQWPALPIAVLVDDKTASAAEIVAGALQDHDRAVIVGMRTYGKGSAQNVYPIDSVGALKLTTARWFTPAGRSISKVVSEADDDNRRSNEPQKPPEFKTDAGRTVFGGGGISPDVTVGDTTVSEEERAFMRAVGKKSGSFRDALVSFALAAKMSGSVRAQNFTITPAMLDDVYARMLDRGVTVPRSTYDDVAPLVSRLLSYEIARYVFGADEEFRRRAADDRALQEAQRLLVGVRSQRDVFARAAQRETKHSLASSGGETMPSSHPRPIPRRR
jgi:carboxyl-terminal processing protease